MRAHPAGREVAFGAADTLLFPSSGLQVPRTPFMPVMAIASTFSASLKSIRRIFGLLMSSSPRWTLLVGVASLLEIVLGLLALYLIKVLVDTVSALPAGAPMDGGALEPVVRVVLLTGGCTLAFLMARTLSNLAREAQGLHLADYVNDLIQAHSIRLDLSFFESPRYFDTLQRARSSGGQRPAQVATNIVMLVKNSLLLAGVVVVLGSISGLVLLILAVVLAPALLVRLYFTRRMYDWYWRRAHMERESSYLDRLITSDHHAKELRIGVLGAFFRGQYAALRGTVRTEQLGIGRRRAMFESLVAALSTLAFFGALGYLAAQTVQGRHSVGDLALFLVVFQRAQAMGQEIVAQTSQLYEDNLYLGLLFEYLDIAPILQDAAMPAALPAPAAMHLRFDGVGFTYPGTGHKVLHDITLELPPGRVVALVGANGSGKTTLIKLMSRLYDPSEGRITLGGRDICDFAQEEYRRVFSVIFQDFARYAATVGENIRFGDIRLPVDSPRIREAAALSQSDGFIRGLAAGYDTRLTRMFDGGEELSQGQWQRIALARAFAANSRILVLDEPTSALDPGVEFELFKDFKSLIGDRAALVISHRLSTIRQADFIYVLDQGRIGETGTHDQLMDRQGAYARLFDKQAYFYRDSGDAPGRHG